MDEPGSIMRKDIVENRLMLESLVFDWTAFAATVKYRALDTIIGGVFALIECRA
jgi:hypothetical protein